MLESSTNAARAENSVCALPLAGGLAVAALCGAADAAGEAVAASIRPPAAKIAASRAAAADTAHREPPEPIFFNITRSGGPAALSRSAQASTLSRDASRFDQTLLTAERE